MSSNCCCTSASPRSARAPVMVPSRSSSSSPSTIAPIVARKNGAAVRTVPSARRQSGDRNTSSVGMLGTKATPSEDSLSALCHRDCGARPMVTSVPGPW